MSRRVSFTVRGKPPTPWGSNEWAWRSAVAVQARAVASTVPDLPPPSDARFTAEIVFHLGASNFERADLDNLAKPVLDTVFLPRNPQVQDRSLTGAIFRVDDDRVVRLALEKRAARTAEEEGVDVSIGW